MKIRPRTLFGMLLNWRELLCSFVSMRQQTVADSRSHLLLCADWLLHCQERGGDGGYSAAFSLASGWSSSYVETSGYIIPTMFDLANVLKSERYRSSALRAGEWLLTMQQMDGSFLDIERAHPQVFDTGQDLLGLIRLYRETSDHRYANAARRAGDWLVGVQDEDGSWSAMGHTRGKPSTYHTRVAGALLDLAVLTGEDKFNRAATANLRWALSRRLENGFFLDADLDGGTVLHTMVYVLEGFLIAYKITGEQVWLEAVLSGAEPILHLNAIVPNSFFDQDFRALSAEKCIPGLAQWSDLCISLHSITGDGRFLEAATRALFYLKSKQLRCRGELLGALPASVPFWGLYQPMSFPNWGVKFFADALISYLPLEGSVWKEQELWVSRCMAVRSDGGAWDETAGRIDPLDSKFLATLRWHIKLSHGREHLRVLDLGCGKGRYMAHLAEAEPTWQVEGVDPYTYGNPDLKEGSAYSIPFPSNTFDAVYCAFVLQHVSDTERALCEILRVLKPSGTAVVFDRDLISGRGLLKPYHEITGRWIYPWDSPFRERWYSGATWLQMFRDAGFESATFDRVRSDSDTGLRKLLKMNSMLIVRARKVPNTGLSEEAMEC